MGSSFSRAKKSKCQDPLLSDTREGDIVVPCVYPSLTQHWLNHTDHHTVSWVQQVLEGARWVLIVGLYFWHIGYVHQ